MAGLLTLACGGASGGAAAPSGGYDGQWSGTIAQGGTIAFTVASTQRLTTITVNYTVGGCAGSRTFANLDVEIGVPPAGPSRAPTPQPGPGFGFGSGSPEEPEYIQVSGWFPSSTTATGTVVLLGFPGCGNAVGLWNATRR
jgi:hypothetical protein